MSAELDEQLRTYGDWLQETYAVDLAAPRERAIDGAVSDDASTDGGGVSWTRRAAWAAAALLLVVGVAGLSQAQLTSEPPAAAADFAGPVDPPEHLFVLPNDRKGLVFANGEITVARSDDDEKDGATTIGFAVIGTEVDDSYTDLVSISVTDSLPSSFGLDNSTEVDTPTGPALVADDRLPVQRLAQLRDERWLLLSGARGDGDLVDVLATISIDPSGSLELREGVRTIIEEFSPDTLLHDDYLTMFEITDEESGLTFDVETATSPSALALGVFAPGPARPTEVNGTSAWVLTRGEQTGIVWRATPNRVIAIGSDAPLEEIAQMAERLQTTTEADWLDALPGAFVQR